MAFIEIHNLKKEYQNRRRYSREDDSQKEFESDIKVFDLINLSVEDGEMVCILGPSGCGKSTLLRMIAGFDFPTSGTILIKGDPVKGPRPDNIFVFQQSGLLPWMSVFENVGLGLRAEKDKKKKEKRVMELIEMVELEGFENHYPHQLSGGMQRRCELARALAVNPNMLIMDEPFSGLDFLTHMKMREEVVNMHEYIKKTTLMVTHDIDDALIMGDHVVIMGGRPAEIILDQRLDFERPRDFAREKKLCSLREDIYLILGVNYAV